MSDASINQIILGIPTILAAVGALIVVWRKVNDVEKKVDDTKAVADATHTLTNSATGANLELLVSAYTQLLAKDPDDVAVQSQLETSKKNLTAHKISQGIVDAGTKK